MLISSCSTTGAVQTDEGYCALYKPVFVTRAEINELTNETKRAILRNNLVYKELCA